MKRSNAILIVLTQLVLPTVLTAAGLIPSVVRINPVAASIPQTRCFAVSVDGTAISQCSILETHALGHLNQISSFDNFPFEF